MLPTRLPTNTHPQFERRALSDVLPSRTPSGKRAKLPVTSSRPRSTIMTKPTGKTSAPTSPTLVCRDAVKARVVAKPRNAPERNPRSKRSRTGSWLFVTPALTICSTTASGFTYDMVTHLRWASGGAMSIECREVSCAHGEAAVLGHDRKRLRAELGVRGAGPGLHVEAVAVERADHLVALDLTARERAARVRARVLEGVERAPAAEDGDLAAVHHHGLAGAFRELLSENDRPAAGVVRPCAR